MQSPIPLLPQLRMAFARALPAWHGLLLLALTISAPAVVAAAAAPGASVAQPPIARDRPSLFAPPTRLRYDLEYPGVDYAGTAEANPVARLQARLDRAEAKLAFNPVRGYLDALLAELDIDPSSQMLVFSKTSFQVASIRAASPRALYFNEDTYVAWIQGGGLLEIGTMDTELGPVFYSLPNSGDAGLNFDRPLVECISCHDSLTMTGGGVPRFIIGSGYVGINGEQLTHEGRILTTDRTPIRSRWGGWYVTGQHGEEVHLGNLQVRSANELVELERVRRGNIDDLEGLFDTGPYLTSKSDIVALLVFQHQAYVQNLITRVNFEVRTAELKEPGTISPEIQSELNAFMDALVNGMLFVDAVGFKSRIAGNSGFDSWFEGRGIKDRRGRSLRQLDLDSRLFSYPLSYLVYSEAFDALPASAKSYVYGRILDVLTGTDRSEAFSHLSPADRKATLEILTETKPDFAQAAKALNRRG